jgi:hypothetical protein
MDPGDTGDLPEKKKQRGKRRVDGLSKLYDQGNVRAKQSCNAGRGEMCSSSSSDDENELQYNYNEELKFPTENYPVDRITKSDHSHEASDNDTEELEYLSKPPKPTRSGRIPQPKKFSQIEDDITLGNKRKRESNSLVSSKSISKPGTENKLLPLEDLTNVEPGSLVVIATQSPTNPGHHVYKVFMVAPKPAGLPGAAATVSPVVVPLSPTSVQSVTSNVPNSQLCGESQSTGE